MHEVAIVTDSGAAIPEELVVQMTTLGGFSVVDMPVMIQGKEEDSSRLHEEIVVAHALGEQVRTSSPSVGLFQETFENLLEQGYRSIVCIVMPEELSATYNNARLAAEAVNAPILVFDSKTIAMAYGHAVCIAHQLAVEGKSAPIIAAVAREICENSEIFFVIPTLDALRRGGRVHPALARVGQLMQIRPVGTVIEGKLTYIERPRTIERAHESLVQHTVSEIDRRHRANSEMEEDLTPPPSGQIVALHYCGKRQQAEELLSKIPVQHRSSTVTSALPPVLSAHTGVGAIAFVIY